VRSAVHPQGGRRVAFAATRALLRKGAKLWLFVLVASAPLAQAPAAACPQSPVAKDTRKVGVEAKFDWPVSGRIVIQCWTEDRETIAIATEDDAAVRAAQSGFIVYAGALKGYGQIVMIRHVSGFISATYGGIDDLRVKTGDHIERGQPIGFIRAAQDFPGIGLKFEIRRAAKAVDARPLMSTPEPHREPAADPLSAR